MAERVIAEFEAVIQPHPESLDALVDLAGFIELLFVDETDHGNFLVAEGAQQLRSHGGDVGGGETIRHARGKIVDRYGHLAVDFSGLACGNDRKSAQDASD